jgi:uncharacterized membrane protein YbaN (DUF454 family)
MHSKNRARFVHHGPANSTTADQAHGPDTRIDREHTSQRLVDKGDAKFSPLRVVYLIAGLVCIVLGLIGILLPVLPTTPFILLASWCFSRSSRRLEAALLRSRLLGPFLRDWRQHRAIRRRVRYLAVGCVATMTFATCALSDVGYATKACIVALACIGVVVIVRIPVLPTGTSNESTRVDAVGETTRTVR